MKTIYEFLLGEHLLNEHLLKNKTAASTQDNDCVDLGLPSGLLWAKCNIGADDPYEYGDYFMWGSTEPNISDDCDWTHAPFNNGSSSFDIAYFDTVKDTVCPGGILAPRYDAASIIMGDECRLPTIDDFIELIDNTKRKWIHNYKDSKINGMLFQANNADLGTELFIPASGYRGVSSFHNRGRNLYLWSSSLFTSSPYYARNLYFNNSSCYITYDDRFYGFCMRGVKENK